MIVVDSSAMLEVLLQTPRAITVDRLFSAHDDDIRAPFLIDLEVMHGLRRYAAREETSTARSLEALAAFRALPIQRYPHLDLLDRVWTLRHNLSAYDATYVALAEALDAPLVTCDARLAAAPGSEVEIELVRL